MSKVHPPSRKQKQNKKKNINCPSCKCDITIRDYQQNILICENCGRILKENIKDRGPEWRAYNQKDKEKRSRGGAPMTYVIHDKGLSTKIDWKNKDGKGNKLSPEKRQKVYRMRKWNKRTKMSKSIDRNLVTALSEINRMSSQLSLSENVQENASKLYRKAVKKNLVRGRSIEGVASALLYIASRKSDIPRTLEEVTEVSRVNKKEITRTYRFLIRKLDIHLAPTNPLRYIARLASSLDITDKAKVKAMELVRKSEQQKLNTGKSPSGTAAAAVYIACLKCGENKTQKEVAKIADVTEVTIRNRYKEIIEALNIDT